MDGMVWQLSTAALYCLESLMENLFTWPVSLFQVSGA